MARYFGELDRLASELVKAEQKGGFSFETATAGHGPQLAYVTDKAKYIVAMCSRRAGKSTGNVFKMGARAAESRSNILYLALTRSQAKKIMWTEGLWTDHCKKYYPEAKHDKADLVTTFPNGSTVAFAGATDEGNVATKLGSKLHLALLDEAQSQRGALLHRLVYDTLPPALSDDGGQLVLSGTIPEVPAGFFWEAWQSPGFSKHSWSRFANPFLKDQRARLEEYLAASGLPESDPLVQRDWFGQCVFDESALAFRYDQVRNGYREMDEHTFTLLDQFAAGIDPGARDRCAIVIVGWGKHTQNVYQVAEWVSPTNAGTVWSDVGRKLQFFNKKYPLSRCYTDGTPMTIDTFSRDFGVPVLEAAKKRDRKGQVMRTNDLLQRGVLHINIGSELEGDLLKTQWDKDSLARGQPEWSSANHPDVADAMRYALQAYFDQYEAPKQKPKSWADAIIEAERQGLSAAYKVPVQYGQDEQAESYDPSTMTGYGN
jgi:hypothetical protein